MQSANTVDTRELALAALSRVGFPTEVADAVRRVDVFTHLPALAWVGLALRLHEGRSGQSWGWAALSGLPEEALYEEPLL